MAYTFITVARAQADLAARLCDPTNQFWGAVELVAYLTEALRTWNALTSTWRQDMVVPLVPLTTWYDLAAVVGSPLPQTVTDQDLLKTMEYHLLEPLTATYPLTWTGSSQFSVTDLLRAVERRRDETLGVTGCAVTRILVNAPIATRVPLPENVIDVRRVVWLPVAGLGYSPVVLAQADLESKADYDWGYTVAPQEPPRTWRQSAEPPLTFDVDRVPSVVGQYECLVVQAGAALSATASSVLGVPNDWAWVVKWGALADLLGREGNAKDPLRAEYAMRRFTEGMGLLSEAPAVLAGRINNIPCGVDHVRNGDDFNPGWQGTGVPGGIYILGDLVGTTSPVLAGTYSATLSVVQNAPIDLVYLQVGQDNYDAVLDYAQHLAAFKLGGTEFVMSIPFYQSFLRRAALYNSKLAALGDYQRTMYEVSDRDPVYSGGGPKEIQ